jgi:hypothetical protein
MSAYEQLLHPTVRAGHDKVNVWHVVRCLFAPVFLIARIFSCWHRRMSRPFTRDGLTYRVCLRCGVQRRFDLDQWTTKGHYYREKAVTQTDISGGSIRQRAKLRLIA